MILVKQVLQRMAAVIIINNENGFIIEVHHRNQPCKNKLSLYKPLIVLTVV